MTDWKEPTPFTKDTEPPAFPVDSLPPLLSQYAKAIANTFQTPVDMGAVGIIATLSCCVQGKFEVQLKKEWREPLNLFTTIIAKPSSLKSQVLNKLIKPIHQYEKQENERLLIDIERNKLEKKILEEDVAKLLKTRHTDEFTEMELFNKQDELTAFAELTPMTLTVGDVTPEALVALMGQNNNRMTIFSTEGGIFNDMASGGYSKKVNLDTYLQGYSGDTIKVNRMGRDNISLDKPCLSMFLTLISF